VTVAGTDIDLGSRRFDRPDGFPVVLGIRPEHVVLDAAGTTWPVEVVELLGSEMLVHAGRPGEASLTLRIANGTPVGDTIQVAFPAAQLHIFDQATGLRMEAREPAYGSTRPATP
jgi:sn-glycerol 3-phosphate transport system ATP-binding protein